MSQGPLGVLQHFFLIYLLRRCCSVYTYSSELLRAGSVAFVVLLFGANVGGCSRIRDTTCNRRSRKTRAQEASRGDTPRGRRRSRISLPSRDDGLFVNTRRCCASRGISLSSFGTASCLATPEIARASSPRSDRGGRWTSVVGESLSDLYFWCRAVQ